MRNLSLRKSSRTETANFLIDTLPVRDAFRQLLPTTPDANFLYENLHIPTNIYTRPFGTQADGRFAYYEKSSFGAAAIAVECRSFTDGRVQLSSVAAE